MSKIQEICKFRNIFPILHPSKRILWILYGIFFWWVGQKAKKSGRIFSFCLTLPPPPPQKKKKNPALFFFSAPPPPPPPQFFSLSYTYMFIDIAFLPVTILFSTYFREHLNYWKTKRFIFEWAYGRECRHVTKRNVAWPWYTM